MTKKTNGEALEDGLKTLTDISSKLTDISSKLTIAEESEFLERLMNAEGYVTNAGLKDKPATVSVVHAVDAIKRKAAELANVAT
jgi:hypothetical protein